MRNHKPGRSALIIDDDKAFCEAIREYLSGIGIETRAAHTCAESLEICSREKVDLVLLDQRLPDGDGVSLCAPILQWNDDTKIIFITAYPSFDNAVGAIKAGAIDYLPKPFDLEELELNIRNCFRTQELERIARIHKYKSIKESEEAVLIGEDGGFDEVLRVVDLAASVDAPVLVTGETGTGKNAVAEAIHFKDRLGRTSFVSINCAALPASLIETELFGHEKGAFTGAVASRKGIFEMADGGTLFLDEIGEMPVSLQSKLLGVLEDRKVRRLGGEGERTVNVRVIAATNTSLEDAVRDRRFREDLFYRLSVVRIHLPPLRERRRDIPPLCDAFVRKIAKGREIRIPDDEMDKLAAYDWPGNIRELRNIIERAIILQKGPVIRPSEHLRVSLSPETTRIPSGNGILLLEEMERRHIEHALRELSGNYTRAASALGISLSTLKRKIREYGLGRTDPKRPAC
ncbi:MAG: sigma-54 dependent transcriptional regulator [bacterium]